MSKVVVLGGAGEVGQWLVRDLASRPAIDTIVVADVATARASALAAEIGGSARAVPAGADGREQLLLELRDAALLMNCTSHQHFDDVYPLALEAGVTYADLLSEPTARQRAAAAEAGITVVSGLGLSPGLTQVLARDAADRLDAVDEVHVSGVSWRTIAPSAGGLDTVLWELADDTPGRKYFQAGRFHRASFLDGARWVDFLEPVGRHRVYYVPHPETVSLARNIPGLRFCATRVSWRDELMEDMRVLNKYGLLDEVPLDGAAGRTVRQVIRDRIWQLHGEARDDRGWALVCTVEVVGVHAGRAVKRTYRTGHPAWGHDVTGRVTGVCAAVGAEILATAPPPASGWLDPELAFDPAAFLSALAERQCIPVVVEERALDGDAGD